MWSPLADRPPRSVAPAPDELRPPVAEVGRDLDPDAGEQPAGLGDEPAEVLDRHRRRPARRLALGRVADPGPPVLRGRGVGDLRRLAPVVAVCGARSSGGSPPGGGRGAAWTAASASSAATRSSSDSPMPTRIPLVNGIRSSPAASIVSSRRAGCLVGEPWWTTRSSRYRLEHQALGGGHLPQAGQVLAAEHAEVRVRQQATLERPLAHPHDVGGEVGEAELGELSRRRPGSPRASRR